MKFVFAPKYYGLAYAATVSALAIAAVVAVAWVPRWLPLGMPARGSAAEVLDPEIARLDHAATNLRQAALFERSQRTGREDGSESILTLYSPSAVSAAALESQPFDPSRLNVVIVETARGRTAMIEGATVRIGERTPGGGIVRAIERTGVVIEDSAGAKRSVDIRDRFVQRDTVAVMPAPLKPPTPPPALASPVRAPTNPSADK